jgi:hypothetical protein
MGPLSQSNLGIPQAKDGFKQENPPQGLEMHARHRSYMSFVGHACRGQQVALLSELEVVRLSYSQPSELPLGLFLAGVT